MKFTIKSGKYEASGDIIFAHDLILDAMNRLPEEDWAFFSLENDGIKIWADKFKVDSSYPSTDIKFYVKQSLDEHNTSEEDRADLFKLIDEALASISLTEKEEESEALNPDEVMKSEEPNLKNKIEESSEKEPEKKNKEKEHRKFEWKHNPPLNQEKKAKDSKERFTKAEKIKDPITALEIETINVVSSPKIVIQTLILSVFLFGGAFFALKYIHTNDPYIVSVIFISVALVIATTTSRMILASKKKIVKKMITPELVAIFEEYKEQKSREIVLEAKQKYGITLEGPTLKEEVLTLMDPSNERRV